MMKHLSIKPVSLSWLKKTTGTPLLLIVLLRTSAKVETDKGNKPLTDITMDINIVYLTKDELSEYGFTIHN